MTQATTKVKKSTAKTKTKKNVKPWVVDEAAAFKMASPEGMSNEAVAEKALVVYERANALLSRTGTIYEFAQAIVEITNDCAFAKDLAEEVDTAHFEAFAATLAAAEALHASVKKMLEAAKETVDQSPPGEDDLHEIDG